MSTRIHNARYSSLPLLEVHKRLLPLKPIISEVARQIVSTAIAANATIAFDEISAGLRTPPEDKDLGEDATMKSLVHQSFQEVCDRFKTSSTQMSRDPEIDTHFGIALIPTEDLQGTLMICYCEHEEMLDIVYNSSWNVDFHYQDSTDHPEDISVDEWEHRRVTWEEAMPTGRPSDVGLVFEMFNGQAGLRTDLEAIMACIPDTQNRIKSLARTAYIRSIPEAASDFGALMSALDAYFDDQDLQKKWHNTVRPVIVPIDENMPVMLRDDGIDTSDDS